MKEILNKEEQKYYISCVLFSVVLIILEIKNYLPVNIAYSVALVIGSIAMALFSILLMKWEECKLGLINRKLFILITLFGLAFVIAGITMGVKAYFAIGIIFCVIFPGVYLALVGYNRTLIYKMFSNTVTINAIVVFIISLLFIPILKGYGYSSIFGNPNLFGNYLIVVMISAIYNILNRDKPKLNCTIFGVSITFMIATMSRTLVVSFIVVMIIFCISFCRLKHKDNGNSKRKGIIIIILSLCISFIFLSVCTNRVVSSKIGEPICDTLIKSYNLTEEREIAYDFSIIKAFNNKAGKGINKPGEISSGRFDIWKLYINELGVNGHSEEELRMDSVKEGYKSNAHNAYIQVSYNIGLIGGGIFIILIATILIGMLKRAFFRIYYNKLTNEDVVMTMIGGTFFIFSMLGPTYTPFTSFVAFAFWVLIFPLYIDNKSIIN